MLIALLKIVNLSVPTTIVLFSNVLGVAEQRSVVGLMSSLNSQFSSHVHGVPSFFRSCKILHVSDIHLLVPNFPILHFPIFLHYPPLQFGPF